MGSFNVLRICWRILKAIVRLGAFLILFALVVVLLFRPNYPFGVGWNDISRAARDNIFNCIDWEISALSSKVGQTLWGQHPFLDEESQSRYVRDYMSDLARVHQLESEIEAAYIDPSIDDPQSETAHLRAQRDQLRADLAHRQSLAESILEGQVATVLVEQGFGLWGQLLPPMSMRFTEMPNMLITSPRDRIERDTELTLDPMPIEEIIALENRVAEEQDLSALVVPLGGMALYPAMIRETSSIPRAVEVFAHEWVHHYFFFYPLGLNYFIDTDTGNREALIINETVADIFGNEVARLVLERYYPEFITDEETEKGIVHVSFRQQDAFDYGAAMHQTRVTVDKDMAIIQAIHSRADQLRADGFSEKADSVLALADYYLAKTERYMEARRVIFHENGYHIRKMNQAYFAFYGGYQGGIPGIGGEDPIGPAVRDIRAMSNDLHTFIVTLRSITTREELVNVRDQMRLQTEDTQ
jgi:hypothetical protein